MIKNIFKLIIIMVLMNSSCTAQKNSLEQNIDAPGSKQQLEDSVLQKLQLENDIVIAAAVENYAWVKSKDYRIIARKNNEWKGYTYHVNLMRNTTEKPVTIINAFVDKQACDSLLQYINENKAWEIKGDNGKSFCADAGKKCNINDAPSARLLIITKTSFINPSYYAPDFYERCCPEKQRGLFLSITKKIRALFNESAFD